MLNLLEEDRYVLQSYILRDDADLDVQGYESEVAGVIAMLCTPDSAWCTGSVICANGGFRFSI